ncbi:muskelin isoform X2 [Macrosteles quadrilineatus]|uniref:muskelin isoform X2 n=1 Tax=Macrosteles quadrilineatus TaxID=74068 RepID=UPI0023E0B24D|nr:muskelin isoform X2 [Macrosteles quadrilineatus]
MIMAAEDSGSANTVDIAMEKLDYSVHKCSSFSASFVPSNIQENKSTDQTSRWSSESNNPPQFLILKLSKPAIVKSITFGKYEKNHVCNLKKFKIFGGMTEERMLELLDTGLRNDNIEETFPLRHNVGGHAFPCRYIKIMPLQSWGPCFNFSIWFVLLSGVNKPEVVEPALEWFIEYQKREAIRLCLKHFRQMNYTEAFDALQRETQVELEDPLLSRLHSTLVEQGDYQAAEGFMEQALTGGLLNWYVSKQEYRAVWHMLASDKTRPGMRGGHQMCMDPHTETIYLLGGWDGNQDLSDLWAYHVPTKHWTLITRDTELEGGPSARSCHKMCLDPERRQIFTLGRYLDTQYRTPENLKSDFYVYDIDSNQWTLITDDTATMGGPQLIFDHQMCMDVAARTIYVFGGRVLTAHASVSEERPGCLGLVGSSEPIFSGLYSYHVATNTWKLLCSDIPPSNSNTEPGLRSRVGHSMLFHPIERKLFIFAGQRSKEYLNDFLTYDVDTGVIRVISDGSKKHINSLSAAGFTQRATIDPTLNEIYVLSNENTGEQYWNKMQHVEPCPRFAHQLVYDHVNKVHYLFGGNPGRSCLPKLRLDDFWKLSLFKPSHSQLLQRCKVLIRTFRYRELAMTESLSALHYLQTSLSEIIDHQDPDQTKEFQQLASLIFQDKKCQSLGESDLHQHRFKLYEQLAVFFPESMTQPTGNLMDLVPL